MRLVIEGHSANPTNADPVLLKEIRRAHRCFEALVLGQVRTVAELATVEGISDRYVSSLLPLAFLAPEIVDRRGDRRGPASPRTDSPSSDQDRRPSDRVGGTETAAGPPLTEPECPKPNRQFKWRRHTRSRPKRAAGSVSGSPSSRKHQAPPKTGRPRTAYRLRRLTSMPRRRACLIPRSVSLLWLLFFPVSPLKIPC